MKKVWLLLILVTVLAMSETTLSAQSAGSLPLSVSLQANLSSPGKVSVSWTILTKLTTEYFQVEKSNDGMSWHSIAFIHPDSSTAVPFTYSFTDEFPLQGANFYRVQMGDKSGRITFTAVKMVRVAALCNIALYPNPSSAQVNISLGSSPVSDWSVTLINGQGQVVLQKKYSKTSTSIYLPVQHMPNGNYVLQINDGGSRQIKKLIINHN